MGEVSPVRLPTYSFDRQFFPLREETAPSEQNREATYHPVEGSSTRPHPLLGERKSSSKKDISFETSISLQTPSYLKDHCLNKVAVLPASGYVEMVLAVLKQMETQPQIMGLANVVIHQALPLSNEKVLLTTQVQRQDQKIRIFSGDTVKTFHAEVDLKPSATATWTDITLTDAQLACPERVSVREHYQKCQEQGLSYGPTFQGLQQIWSGNDQGLGKIELANSLFLEAQRYQLHPTLLDACFQVLGTLLKPEREQVYVPIGLDSLVLYQSSATHLWSYVTLSSQGKTIKANLRLWNDQKELVADLKGLCLKAVKRTVIHQTLQTQASNYLYEVAWQEKQKPSVPKTAVKHWLIFSNGEELALELGQRLQEEGAQCVWVVPGPTYEKSEEGYGINPEQPEDFKRLLLDLPFLCEGIVYCWDKPLEKTPTFTQLQEIIEQDCCSILYLIQSLYEVQPHQLPQLWLINQGELHLSETVVSPTLEHASLWGLGKVIRLEHPELCCTSVGMDRVASAEDREMLYEDILCPDVETEIAYDQGTRYVTRLVTVDKGNLRTGQPVQLKMTQSGSLENLSLVPLQPDFSCAADEVVIEVSAVGLNFRDVLNGLGMLQPYLEEMGFTEAQEIPFGGECSGKIVKVGKNVDGLKIGDRVIAALAIGSLASFVRVKADFAVLKPDFLSFIEAATIPSAFLTAYYGLHCLAKIKPGDKVLIHAGAGGVGQAAVQFAQDVGAKVFVTASPAKWPTLKSMGIDHIFNSRTLDFAEQIQQLTDGEGVDLILNSLNGEFIEKNLDILSPGGRFVEIGKIGIWDRSRVQEKRADVVYHVFDLLTIAQEQPAFIRHLFSEVMTFFQEKRLHPLPHQVFSLEDSIKAFRYMAGAKHIGKVVIDLPSPAIQIRAKGVYLITGGWGDLGLTVAQWLIEQGATSLILLGRRQPSSERENRITQLKHQGVEIETIVADIGDFEAVNERLQPYCASDPHNGETTPLTGIIHTAGLIDDGTLVNQSWERFKAVMKPKIAGTWNLHLVTKNCPLDFFVCFSSIVSLLGSPGQANYVAANAFMDRLMSYRRSLGLVGSSINWGPWNQTNMVNHGATQSGLTAKGISLIDSDWGLERLAELLSHNSPHIGVLEVDWSKFLGQHLKHSPFFSEVKQEQPEEKVLNSQSMGAVAGNQPMVPNKEELLKYLQKQLAKVLGFSSVEEIAIEQDFSEFGLDSLMAVEFANILQTQFMIPVTANTISDYSAIVSLGNYLWEQVKDQQETDALTVNVSTTNDPNYQNNQDNGLIGIEEIPDQFYQFERLDKYLSLQQDLKKVEELGNLFFRVHDGVTNNLISIEGQGLINYSSYNYLGLSGLAEVSLATKKAIEQYGTSVCASRVLGGEISLHQTLEQEIADFLGTEDCIVYIGGHATNVSTIGHLFEKNDLILYDALSHNSIQQGCLLSGATAIAFSHNNWQELEQLLQQHRLQYEKVLIVVEGIYSAEGDIAPLPEIVALKKRYKTFLMVDEAHSIGVLGQSGKGISEHFGVSPKDVDLWMGTLSKSFASCGGYIAASKAIVQYLKYTSPGFVFSVGMSPANTAAALAAMKIVKAEPDRVHRLQQRSKFFLNLAQKFELNTGLSNNSPIIPIIIGEPQQAVNLSNALFREGINVQPMVYPSVPYNAARLRFFMSCDHSEEEISLTIDKLLKKIRT